MTSAFVHATSVVDEGATLGAGTKVWHFCHVSAGAVLGEACTLGQNVFVGPEVRIGDRVRIQNNVSVYTAVEVEDDAFLGPSCVFTNVSTPRAFVSRRHEFGRTRVGRGASIGANATVVCGHDVGDYSLVGAGAVVTKDVLAYALVVGNPARQMGWVCRCGVRLADGPSPQCRSCGARYEIADRVCRPVGS